MKGKQIPANRSRTWENTFKTANWMMFRIISFMEWQQLSQKGWPSIATMMYAFLLMNLMQRSKQHKQQCTTLNMHFRHLLLSCQDLVCLSMYAITQRIICRISHAKSSTASQCVKFVVRPSNQREWIATQACLHYGDDHCSKQHRTKMESECAAARLADGVSPFAISALDFIRARRAGPIPLWASTPTNEHTFHTVIHNTSASCARRPLTNRKWRQPQCKSLRHG